MKKLLFLCFMLCAVSFAAVFAEDTQVEEPVLLRPRLFSTSTDWESVTGLRYSEFSVEFIRDKTIGKKGWELYFLDGFPCIAQAQTARVWISPSNFAEKDRVQLMRLNCVKKPDHGVQFAWREAKKDDFQNTTTGILTCYPNTVGKKMEIRLQDCVKGKGWNE
jgi:hypothetical protein